MATQDERFLEALDIPAARVASALHISRQAVSRAIRSEREFFKPAVLAQALSSWRASDPNLFAAAKAQVCLLYPDAREAVLEALELDRAVPFSATLGGEYWLITGDYLGFKTNLLVCSQQLESLCGSENSQVKLFIEAKDQTAYIAAHRLAKRFEPGQVQVFPCNADLRVMPTTLLRIDESDSISLFGVSDKGFISLSASEATRLRIAIENRLVDSVKADLPVV